MKQTRDTSKKRKAIFEGAIAVFTEMGYKEASMDRIAEVAGVSKNTIYNHFQSKENLFHSIISDFLSGQQTVKNIPYRPDLPLENQLEAFVKAEVYLIDDPERRNLSRLLTSVFIMDINFSIRVRAQFGSPQANLIAWLESAKADGRLAFESARKTARIFYGMVEGILTWPAVFSNGLSLADSGEITAELISVFLSRFAAVS